MHLVFLISALHLVSANSILTTTSGTIRGTNGLVDDVIAFLGIPYAEPPVGDRRFAKPVPKRKWDEIYNAVSMPPPCAQVAGQPYAFMPNLSNMSEDCLYLNIWTPKSSSSNELKPIIIFLHPGLYMYGSASMDVHDGSKLSSRGDVVFASINYRLGAFGFFWGFTEDTPGSLGVYDQIMAIKWIKLNAKTFGGDPDNMILMGASVGAYNTALLSLSPLTKHLFGRVIIQSGGIITPLFEDDNARLIESSKSIASITGCTNETVSLQDNPGMVVECLRSKPVETIIKAQETMLISNSAPFVPRVNDEILPKSPINLIREGSFRKDISTLIGITKDEGTVMLSFTLPQYFGYEGKDSLQITSDRRARVFSRGAMMLLKVSDFINIAQLYIDDMRNRNSNNYTDMIANIVGDFLVTCPTVFTANFLSLEEIPVYFYKFAFRPVLTPLAEWMGTTHLDDTQYIFGNPYSGNFTSEEMELSHNIMDRWTTFARTGYSIIFLMIASW